VNILYEPDADPETKLGQIIGSIVALFIYAAVIWMVAKPILGF
jgi:hypothetical protein